jgi:hypothetical protein
MGKDMNLKEMALNLLITCLVLIIIIAVILLILNQYSPFHKCIDKPDNYFVQFGKDYISCGELRALNTSEGIIIQK